MKTVQYTASQLLACAKCNGEVVICVDELLTALNRPWLVGTVVSTLEQWDVCGKLGYVYGFQYDEAQLADPAYSLVTSDIEGVFCKGCLTDYIDSWGMPSMAYILSLLAPYFDHVCLVTSEAELAAAIVNVDCNHIVIGESFTLTQSRTIPAGKMVTFLNDCAVTTNGHVFTVNGAFSAGLYSCFVTDIGEVIFGVGACSVAYPQWFGAVADGATDDAPAINQCIGAISLGNGGGLKYTTVATLHFPAGVYRCESGLNFTRLQGLVMTGNGRESTTIVLATGGTPGMDFTGSHSPTIREMQINAGESPNSCNVMILAARNATGATTGLAKWYDVQITVSANADDGTIGVYAYGAEDLAFTNTLITVSCRQGIGFYSSNDNPEGITSLFNPIFVGPASNTVIIWSGGGIADYSAHVGADSVIPAVIRNTRNLSFYGTVFRAVGNYGIRLESDGPFTHIDHLCFIGCRFEGGPGGVGPTNMFFGPDTNTTLSFGVVQGNIFFGTNAVYRQEGVGSAVYIGVWDANAINSTYLIETDGDLFAGSLDCQFTAQVSANNMYGVDCKRCANITDVSATFNNGYISTTGLVEDKRFFADWAALGDTATFVKVYSGTADFNPSIADNDWQAETVLVTAASMGSPVTVSFSLGCPQGVQATASVTAPGTVRVTVRNQSGGLWAPGAGVLRVHVWNQL